MNFNEFLAHAKKRNDVPLDRLAKEVGAHMVLYLLGRLPEIRDDADKGYGLAVRNGLDIDELFLKFFDFEEYWRENGGETITTLYGVYMIDTKELSKKYKELANC